MADGRMLKKQISRSKKLAELKTDSARLLYTWIIPHLDVKGRLEADPHLVKGEIVPRIATFDLENIQEYLEDMAEVGLIKLYQHEGDQFLELVKFSDHQHLREEKEGRSHIPSPDNSGTTPGELPDNSGTTPAQGKARQEKLREVKQREVRSKTGPQESKEKTSAFSPTGDAEKPKDEKPEPPYEPPTKDEIENSSGPRIEALIKDIRVEITKEGILKLADLKRFDGYSAGKNRRAVLHTLSQCYRQRPHNPGGFCRSILEVEDGNFNEREFQRESCGDQGPSREEAAAMLGKIMPTVKAMP